MFKKAIYLWICIVLIIPATASPQDAATLLREADRLEHSFHEAEALQKYKEVLKLQPKNFTAICRSSDLSSRVGHRQTDKQLQANFYHDAKTYAETALKINPQSAEANFVMAVAMGRMAMLSSGREKIQYVNEIKRYAELTLKYDPNNFKAYHVLGKWHYEVSNLNSFERTMARILFGGLPKASLQESIAYYEKSKSLEPTFSVNYLELAKAYKRNHEEKKAKDLLNKLLALPNKIEDDVRVKKEARDLLKEMD